MQFQRKNLFCKEFPCWVYDATAKDGRRVRIVKNDNGRWDIMLSSEFKYEKTRHWDIETLKEAKADAEYWYEDRYK